MLAVLVTGHMLLVFALVTSFFVAPFLEPWYVSVPICVFVYFYCTNPVKCPLTDLENYLRRRLGLRRIGGFVGHYLIRPVKKRLRPRPTPETMPEPPGTETKVCTEDTSLVGSA